MFKLMDYLKGERARALGNSCDLGKLLNLSGPHAICYKKMINSISKDYG